MKIEKLKSIILFILVITSITLTANKWYSDNLWSFDHDLFSSAKNAPDSKKNTEYRFDSTREILMTPKEIIINNENTHIRYIKTSVNYDLMCGDIDSLFDEVSDSTKISTATYWEWTEKLKKKSCYFSYFEQLNAIHFFDNINAKQAEFLGNIKEVIILPENDSSEKQSIVYVKPASENNIKKLTIKNTPDHILYQIKKAQSSDESVNYAFELKSGEVAGYKKWLYADIPSNTVIQTDEKRSKILNEKNLFSNISSDDLISSDIVAKFGYNPSTIRKYIESDNSLVLVENYGTIKLHTSGLLEFKAVDAKSGISIDKNSPGETFMQCLDFIDDVTECLDLGKKTYFEIISQFNNVNSNTFTVDIDYKIDGAKIIFPEDIYGMNHSISVSVVDGKITRYRQICKNFSFDSDYVTLPDCVDELNDYFVNKHNEKLIINDVFVGYIFDKNTFKWYPIWCVDDSSENIYEITDISEVKKDELE